MTAGPKKPDRRRPWTVREVADYFSVTHNTVYKWNQERRIEYYRLGKEVRYSEDAVLAFEERLKLNTLNEPDRPRPRRAQ
jgi:excisionase family DNA binding protein